jgi:hypothetical protein
MKQALCKMGASYGGTANTSGTVALRVISRSPRTQVPGKELTIREILTYGFPQSGMVDELATWKRSNVKNLWRGMKRVVAARVLNLATFYGQLAIVKISNEGTWIDYGLVSLRVVTTAGVNFIATRLTDANTSIGNFDFHGFGTGGTAEASGDTALVTELTTQYAVDNTRPTGTPSNPSGNVYQSVGTLSPDTGGTIAITEHGLFSASSGVTLLDRSLFSAVNLVAGSDSLQATYQLTLSAGG